MLRIQASSFRAVLHKSTGLAAALQAAGAIHGDFERGFICADVMAYDVLKEIGSEGAVKAAGKLRQEGKNYVVVDGGTRAVGPAWRKS